MNRSILSRKAVFMRERNRVIRIVSIKATFIL